MERRPVRSSSIAGVGFDAARSTLEIEFADGGVYQYFSVPEFHFDGLLAAGSVGHYFHLHIKGHYKYLRVL
jgi:hypothetical protein